MINSCTKWIITKWFLSKKTLLPISLMLIIVLLNTLYFTGNYQVVSGGDIISNTFLGYGLGYFHFVSFIFLLLLNNIPLYFFCSFLSDSSIKNSHIFIRIKHPKNWFFSIQISYFIFVLCYYMLAFIETTIIASAFSINSINQISFLNEEINVMGSIWINIVFAFILRVLEIMFIELFFLFLYVNIKKITTTFYIAICPYLLLLFNKLGKNPYGLSSLLRQDSYDSVYLSIFYLMLLCILLFLYFMFFGYKKN